MTECKHTEFIEKISNSRADYPFEYDFRDWTERFAASTLALLFPHFSPEPNKKDVEQEIDSVGTLLCEALRALNGQAPDPAGVKKAFCQQLPEVYEKLLVDAQAFYDNDPAAESVHEVIFAYPGFYAISINRIANILYEQKVPFLPRLLSELAHARTGIDIHPGAKLGEAFFIDHGTGVVIGETAEVGDRVKIYQGVTLGAYYVNKALSGEKRHPTIGDEVVIYAHATILGGTTVVGAGSVIGANSWVTQSVPDGSVVTHRTTVQPAKKEAAYDVIEFNI
ncbi:MAG TPA: serine O-acetyltransferase EpsC [Fimbriimonadaceae bacterium]|jgi:serine O-acetyltransferase